MTPEHVCSLPDVVWHVGWDDHGDFNKAGYCAVDAPCCLVDHLSEAFLFDGVGVVAAGFEQVADDLFRPVAVTAHEILADQVSVFCKGGLRLVVHV